MALDIVRYRFDFVLIALDIVRYRFDIVRYRFDIAKARQLWLHIGRHRLDIVLLSRILDSGPWAQEFGSRAWNPGSWIQDPSSGP